MLLVLALYFYKTVVSDPIILTNGDISITGNIPVNGSAQFLGITYAEAARWEDPLIKPLSSVVATTEPKGCPQICDSNINCPRYISEDCLQLNVWTPFTSFENLTTLRPVLIYIHGGAFKTGHGYLEEFGNLAKSLDSIIVGFNYRLSIFGFFQKDLKFENFGIKDQRTALLWIYENIGKFGGDVQKISVLGHSAGALSALIHRAHPLTRFIMNNMILMSIPAIQFASEYESKITIGSLNSTLCESINDAVLFECLKNQSMMRLLVAGQEKFDDNQVMMTKAFPPRVDNFDILDHPFDILKNATYMNGTNVMMGTTSNETYLFLNKLYPGAISAPIFDIILLSLFGSEKASIKDRYPNAEISTGDQNQKSRLTQITSDAIFTCPLKNSLNESLIAANVYSYYFETPFPGQKDSSSGNICEGTACHGTDLAYLLDIPFQEEYSLISLTFRKFISNFLLSGNPSLENNTWEKDGLMRFASAKITFQYNHPLEETCDFWSKKQDFYVQLDPPTFARGYSFIEILGLIFFVIFIFVQIALLIFSWKKNQRILKIQNAIEIYDHQALNLSSCFLEDTHKNGEDTFYSVLSTPTPLELSCENLTVEYSNTRVLSAITASFIPGSLTAIMGPSGCGKTTLITALRGRLKRYSNGDIYLGYQNIHDISFNEMNSFIGFVSQHDPPFWGLSCRELLTYYAHLQSPTMTDEEISQKTLDVIKLMELSDCCDIVLTKPGTTKGGLSGGQLRRVAIAVVLLQMPSVILLDEPTSGLDSEHAFEVIKVLSNLAAQGHTIVCTIHQPRIEVYQLFSDVLVLTKMGVLYHGSPTGANEYLEAYSEANLTFDKAQNPADSLLKLASNYEDLLSSSLFKANDGSTANIPSSFAATQTTLICDSVYEKALPIIVEVQGENFSLKSKLLSNLSLIELYLDESISNCQVPAVLGLNLSDISLNKDIRSITSEHFSMDIDKDMYAADKRIKKIAAGRRLFIEIQTLNARWWNIRPFSRKLMMLFICLITAIIVGIIHRRPYLDITSFELQMKGIFLACIGLPAIKNIAISYDFYLNRDLYEFDLMNGISTHLGFFIHRIIYETSVSSLEALITLIIGTLVLDCNPNRILPSLTIFLAYYNTVATFFTCLFSTRLGVPEARSISFLIQALFTITNGIWLTHGESPFYIVLEWIKYINPQYWAISSLIHQLLYSSGKCVLTGSGGECLVAAGDAFESHIGLVDISSSTSILVLIAIWTMLRIVQYIILRSNELKY